MCGYFSPQYAVHSHSPAPTSSRPSGRGSTGEPTVGIARTGIVTGIVGVAGMFRCDGIIRERENRLGPSLARPGHRSGLVAHQFVAGAAACESEEPSVGGVDSVDAALFDAFDYVALGHLHSPQKVGRETLRYCGTPLKYSFSEAGQCKSATFVELGAKGEVHITTAPLTPRHELRGLRGSYTELTDRRCYEGTAVDDYLYITLTDEQDVPDALARLRVIYPNLMQLDYDNQRTRQQQEISAPERTESISPLEHLAAFYQLQNNQPLTAEQTAFCQELIEEIWKEGDTV